MRVRRSRSWDLPVPLEGRLLVGEDSVCKGGVPFADKLGDASGGYPAAE